MDIAFCNKTLFAKIDSKAKFDSLKQSANSALKKRDFVVLGR